MIVATAGHIDHGKTSLVKALTGIDTDRLPEEKARGMSIDLGFAYTPLADGSVLGFVDVPGHERFIKNMLAGVTAVDAALLVIAADDGPMPQTIEHLAILDLLGVDTGVVALTKIDRVDAVRLEEVTGEIEALLASTQLAGADVIAVSAVTGEGIADLKANLETIARATVEKRRGGNFRLAVDRVFTVAGAGLVVTGAVFSGEVRVGDSLILSPVGMPVRVRAIHAQNREAEIGIAGQRCALNLTGTDLRRTEISRGDWVVAEPVHAPTSRFDARIRVLAGEKAALKHWTSMHVHVGAAEIPGRIAILEGSSIPPGGEGLVQVVLDRKIGVLRGDAVILRDQSAQRTVAGGRAVDPFPPARGRARPERLAFIKAMEIETAKESLAALLASRADGVDLNSFAVAWNLTDADRQALWKGAPMVRSGSNTAVAGFSISAWQTILDATIATLTAWHRANPDRPGLSADALRRLLPMRLTVAVFASVLDDLLRNKKLLNAGAGYCAPGFEPRLQPKDSALWKRVQPILVKGHMQPPVVAELSSQLSVDAKEMDRFLVRCARLGFVYQVAKNRFLVPPAVLALAGVAAALAQESGETGFGAAAFRDRSGIGRNFTIELLEYFDRVGLTWRTGDHRKLRKPVAQVFGDERA
jgi:selenocysteine-specific elongation factor